MSEILDSSGELLSPASLAALLGVPVNTVYAWNSRGEGPRRVRIGRHVRYRRRDVEKWLSDRYEDGAGDGGADV